MKMSPVAPCIEEVRNKIGLGLGSDDFLNSQDRVGRIENYVLRVSQLENCPKITVSLC